MRGVALYISMYVMTFIDTLPVPFQVWVFIATNLRTGHSTVMQAFGTPGRFKSDALAQVYGDFIGQLLAHRPGLADRLVCMCGDGEVDEPCLSRRIKIIGTDKLRSQRITDIRKDALAQVEDAFNGLGLCITLEQQKKLYKKHLGKFCGALRQIYMPGGVLRQGALPLIRPSRDVLKKGYGFLLDEEIILVRTEVDAVRIQEGATSRFDPHREKELTVRTRAQATTHLCDTVGLAVGAHVPLFDSQHVDMVGDYLDALEAVQRDKPGFLRLSQVPPMHPQKRFDIYLYMNICM